MKKEQQDNLGIKAEITREIRKDIELNDNENIAFQNTQDASKAVLRGKFIASNAYIKRRKVQNQ